MSPGNHTVRSSAQGGGVRRWALGAVGWGGGIGLRPDAGGRSSLAPSEDTTEAPSERREEDSPDTRATGAGASDRSLWNCGRCFLWSVGFCYSSSGTTT